jgi:hypothetical protein
MQTDVEALEEECLGLLSEYPDSSQQGKIYAEIAYVIAQAGLRDAHEVVSYGEKALEFPLDAELESRTRVHLSDAFEVLYREAQDTEASTELWNQCVRACLSGLRLLYEQSLPDERVTLPVVSAFDYDGAPGDSTYMRLLDENRAQMAARDRIMKRNTMILHREALVDKCVRLRAAEPERTEEFESIAREIIGREEDVRDLLLRMSR